MSAAKSAAVVALLCLVYGYGLFRDPPKWEEPRRALISIEMITSGDYVVPHLLGEPYLNKPPMFNWLGLAVAGNRAERVGPAAFRVVSLLSLAIVCLLLWRLGVSGSRPRSDPLAALVFATMGIVVQFGRAGEIDMLLCAFTTSALACFEFGRRRRSIILQWIAPQVFVGLGVLTKIVAPAYFYPAALFTAWRRRRDYPFSAAGLVLGLILMSAVVGVWLLAYGQRLPLGALEERWLSELSRRFHAPGAATAPSHILGHVFHYPVVVLGTTLPWTLWLVALLWREPRRLFVAAIKDPFVYLAWIVSLVVVFGHALAVEGNGRYLMPAFPFLAILVARMIRDLRSQAAARPDSAENGGGGMRRWVASGGAFAWTLAVALLYATIYVSTTERARARTGERYRAEALELAAVLDRSLPVVIDASVPYRLVFPLYRLLEEMPRAKPPEDSAYTRVARSATAPPQGGTLLGEAGLFRAWKVEKEELGGT